MRSTRSFLTRKWGVFSFPAFIIILGFMGQGCKSNAEKEIDALNKSNEYLEQARVAMEDNHKIISMHMEKNIQLYSMKKDTFPMDAGDKEKVDANNKKIAEYNAEAKRYSDKADSLKKLGK